MFMHVCRYGPKDISIYIPNCLHRRNVGEVRCKNIIFLSSEIRNETFKNELIRSDMSVLLRVRITPEFAGRIFIKFKTGSLTNIC